MFTSCEHGPFFIAARLWLLYFEGGCQVDALQHHLDGVVKATQRA